MALTQTISIAQRFCGPPHSGNGGYTCGLLASVFDRPARVRLHVPPPLGRELQVQVVNEQARLLDGDTLIASATPISLTMAPPAPPSVAEAQAASKRYLGFRHHPYPTCFVCGPQRQPGDGLCLFAGPLENAHLPMVAAPFVPPADGIDENGHLRERFIWAALDCPSYFAICGERAKPMLLGEMSLALLVRNVDGQQDLLVYAWAEGRDGRKAHAGSALANAQGKILAVARCTWIEPRAAGA